MKSTKISPTRVMSVPTMEEPAIKHGMAIGETKDGKGWLVMWDGMSRARYALKSLVKSVEPLPYEGRPL